MSQISDIQACSASEQASLLDGLKLIDANKRGFLVVLDEEGRAVGTATDGDLRRAIIAGAALDDPITAAMTSHFSFIQAGADFTQAVELFRDSAIEFIPVLDAAGRLVNIITRGAADTLLLRNIYPDSGYDFLAVDESLSYHEVFNEPWGFYKTTVLNDHFQSKVINVLPGASISLQSHQLRAEHWIIVEGHGIVRIGEQEQAYQPGDHFFIPRQVKHRIRNTSATGNTVFVEVQLGDSFSEDDIVRYEDDYGRN